MVRGGELFGFFTFLCVFLLLASELVLDHSPELMHYIFG
jgi:hypothetical protein